MKTHNFLIGMLGLLMACQTDDPNCLPYEGEVLGYDLLRQPCAGMLVKVTNKEGVGSLYVTNKGSQYDTLTNVIGVKKFDAGVDTSAIDFSKKIYFDFRPDGIVCPAILPFFSPVVAITRLSNEPCPTVNR